jgi:putative phage-type endonuclease
MLTAQQQAIRAKGIGASETPALLGLDRYRNALDIYCKKLGLVDDAPSYHIERGNYLEPALRKWASARLDLNFVGCAPMVHPTNKIVLATPDGLACDGPQPVACLEIKSPGPRTWYEWGEGEQDAPDRYVVQLAQQMLVTGAPRGYIAALLDGDLHTYAFERDAELEQVIVDTIERFWRDHIETQTPPPVDGSPSADEYLKRRFPANRGPVLVADSATEELIASLRAARTERDTAEQRVSLIEQQLKLFVGDADGVTSPAGRISWRCNKPSQKTDWEAIAKELSAPPEIVSKHTHERPGPRVFRVTFPKI